MHEMIRARRSPPLNLSLLFCLALGGPTLARADDAPPAEDQAVAEARREFLDGTEKVKAERWAEALDAFERADRWKPHAITTYNIAQCDRAMGHYTLARTRFAGALKQDEAAHGEQLTESLRVEARGLVAELDKILPRVRVSLRPSDAAIAVDGRPLEQVGSGELLAGTLPPGPGLSPPVDRFSVVLGPGVHVFTVSRRGYQDVVVNRSFAPGSTSDLVLELDKLPAVIHVTSNLQDAVVRVNDADVGNPPVDVSRTAGRYGVAVARRGFVTYEAEVLVRPGERVELAATLHPEKKLLTQQWWFWTAAGALVAGAATGTYFLTRPAPTRPAADGGGLGWFLKTQ